VTLPARLFSVLFFCLVLAGCRGPSEQDAELYVFGTLVEVKLWGVSQDQADRAFADLQDMFRDMHRDWHAWEPGRLTAINEAFAKGESAAGDAWIVAMVRRSQDLEQRSGGRFNPAIGRLIELWGFHTSDYPILGPPPAEEDIRAILDRRPSTLDIRIDGLQLSSANPAVALDFGGIAKGYAVDLAIEHLQSAGIANAIVNAGGDLRAVGMHGDRPWRVAVRKPGGGVIGAVEVDRDESLFTSGNYERYRQDRQERYPHIVDPRSGWPVEGLSSATVITGEGMLADAAATALIVAGPGDWVAVARALGLDQVLVVDDAGQVFLTPEMARRVHFAGDQQGVVVPLD